MTPTAKQKMNSLPSQAKQQIVKLGTKLEKADGYKKTQILGKFRTLLSRYGLTVEDFT